MSQIGTGRIDMSTIGLAGVNRFLAQVHGVRPGQTTGQRALVPVEPASRARSDTFRHGKAQVSRPFAPYLAHLIATANGAPQTRERRRLDPREASGLYQAAASHPAMRKTPLKSL
ncbi:MAG: hypothetical protein BroJett024_09400 [Alphaproteobacteria bacterium]|nr:MAG: hypothetical protein BroJett024_09400 [Alphaproteobacteria bacterium]